MIHTKREIDTNKPEKKEDTIFMLVDITVSIWKNYRKAIKVQWPGDRDKLDAEYEDPNNAPVVSRE